MGIGSCIDSLWPWEHEFSIFDGFSFGNMRSQFLKLCVSLAASKLSVATILRFPQFMVVVGWYPVGDMT